MIVNLYFNYFIQEEKGHVFLARKGCLKDKMLSFMN